MTKPIPGGHRRVDRVLAPEFVADLAALDLTEIRSRRLLAEQEEADLSFLRRMLHGRIDIVRAEIARRDPANAGRSLIDSLVEILSDSRPEPRGLGRHVSVEPTRVDEHRRHAEQAISDAVMSDVGARTPQELDAAIVSLTRHEHEVSETRAVVQKVADVFSEEMTRRYQVGLADVESVLEPSVES